jgi:hypothetical protein
MIRRVPSNQAFCIQAACCLAWHELRSRPHVEAQYVLPGLEHAGVAVSTSAQPSDLQAVLLLLQAGPGNWTYGEEVPEDFVNGYSYAIATGSSYIMALFRQRCLAAGQLQQGQHGQQLWRQRSLQGDESGSDGLCSYKVDYPGGSPVVASTVGTGATSAVGMGAYKQAGAMHDGGVVAGQAGLGRDVSYRLGVQRPAGLVHA